MIDVSPKTVTARRAVARGTASLAPSAFEALRSGTNPKGNVLALAEAAGILAAKKTSDLVPLCHPLPLSRVALRFELDADACAVHAWCEASAEAKTGVEMEALSGVMGALLTIYDLSKAVDPLITLSDVVLELKDGGKHGLWTRAVAEASARPSSAQASARDRSLADVAAGVITVSDRASAGVREDRSGPEAWGFLEARGARRTEGKSRVVSDDAPSIRAAVLALCDSGCDLVVLTGGTGLGPRDVTPETVQSLCDRWIPGLGERLRASGAQSTPMSWLSRSGGGLRGRTLILALPGSPRAVREGLEALGPILGHALEIARGAAHE